MRRFYVDVGWGQMHGWRAGDGPPVLLLHASPLNASFLAPQIEALAQTGFTAIGLDTPGYGASDPLPAEPNTIEAFSAAVLAAADALGLGRFGLYGTATGAQLALAAAKQAPGRITRLVLENCGHFAPERRAAWEEAYFPDLTPQPDGGHLARIWAMATKQMSRFPWHLEPDPALPQAPAPPVETLQRMTRAFLDAGPAYDRAYRLAFHAEEAASFKGLSVPTVLIDWESSVVRRELQALVAEGLPDCVAVRAAGAGFPARLSALRSAFLES
jgi:pimeloyl-ACP methyl ester carboxylesterase